MKKMQWTKFVQRRRSDRKLSVEMTPITVRSNSLFQYYIKNQKMDEWIEIKEELLQKEGSKCWICGIKSNHLHIHEFWELDDSSQIAKLKELHHLCDMCFKIKKSEIWFFSNYGREQLKKLDVTKDDLIQHYCKINKCSQEEFDLEFSKEIINLMEKNKHKWKVDFGDFLKK